MEATDQRLYHVTVAFRQGFGESFRDFEAALDSAELQMQSLLLEYRELESEDFAGIYCEQHGGPRYWRFDYEEGIAVWVPLEDSAPEFAARVGRCRQGSTLVLAPGPGPTDAANEG
jgi:hypothetical protein